MDGTEDRRQGIGLLADDGIGVDDLLGSHDLAVEYHQAEVA